MHQGFLFHFRKDPGVKPKLPRVLAIFLLAGMVMAACAKAPRPRVGVKNVAAELVFGIPPVQEPVGPPGAFPEVPEEIDLTDFEDGFFNPGPAPPPPPPRCPEAGPNEFPDREAPPTIDGKPKVGTYNWKVQGTQRITGVPFPVRLGEFEQRKVQDVASNVGDPQNYTFKTVQKKPGTGNTLLISTFIVDVTNPSPTLKGVLLDKLEEDKQDGSAISTFDPEPDIMYLPIPIQQGTANRFDTTGIDPRTQQVLRHIGFVKERKDVDACGTMIQTWLVDGEYFRATGLGPEQRVNYDYAIATHFGGLIVYERVQSPCEASNQDGTCTSPPDLELETNIGQVDPS